MSNFPPGRFRERPTRPAGVITVNGWRLKMYEISLDAIAISEHIMAAVHDLLARELVTAIDSDVKVGFCVVHHGAEAVWVLADLWSGDIISQHTFVAQLDTPTRFVRVLACGPTACVFELTVHAHEREAFVRHILNPFDGPELDDYLADTLTIRAPIV